MKAGVWVYSLVADLNVMAAWLLSFCVGMCVERCGFATWCCKTHCNGCMDVAWASFWDKAGAGNLVLFRVKWLRPAMKGTSCARPAGAAALEPRRNRFLHCVLQQVVVHVCVVLCVSWLSGCRSQRNGCVIVIVLCCHVRPEMRVCNLMLQKALSWLRPGCFAPWLRAWYYCLLQLDSINCIGMAASSLRVIC